MSLSETLERIDANVHNGLRYKAVDRLNNLILAHPNDLSLRDRLAQLYYDAGFLDAAGRYWILSESNLPHVVECINLYERSVNHSGTQILRDVAFRGNRLLLGGAVAAKL